MFRKNYNILITGSKGQLGSYLVEKFRKISFLKGRKIGKVFGVDIDNIDLSNRLSVFSLLGKKPDGEDHVKIDYVIHCAAATNTVAIEEDPFKFYGSNCLAAKNIAEACVENGIKMVFISTDYVLSERSPVVGAGIQEFPVNQYGMQKLVAELFVKEAFKDKPKDLSIIRSSWMFGNSKSSFVEKFLKNAFSSYAKGIGSCDKPAIVNVADDVFGRPTPVWTIAELILDGIYNGAYGTTDMQWMHTQISRYEWACMIWDAFTNASVSCDEASLHMLESMRNAVKISPCSSSAFASKMKHPGRNDYMSTQNSTSLYADATRRYVNDTKNWHRLMDMAKEVVANEAEVKHG